MKLAVIGLLVLATIVTPAAAISKCSVCEFLVSHLISTGTCTGIKRACMLLDPPADAICFGIAECCCGLLMSFIQKHVGDAHAVCHFAHMCSADKMKLLAPDGKGPIMPELLASNVAGVTWDAMRDFNTSYAATFYDDFSRAMRRADISTFPGIRGSRWVEKSGTNTTVAIDSFNGTCSERRAFEGAPFVTDRYFWQDAEFEGLEMRTLVGPVEKFTKLSENAFFVGYFHPITRLPTEIWAFYRDHFRNIDIITGNTDVFDRSELNPCTPKKN